VAIPDLIPIRHEPGYRTSTIGRYDGGLFFAWVTGTLSPIYSPRGDDWLARKRWYAVLHRFDHDGNHTGSDIWCPGPGIRDGQQERLEAWLEALPGREFCDIAIRLFQLVADGIVFGLVPECHGEYSDGEEQDDWAEFYPGRLGFSSPWDGCYST
jgi:formate hydrogenlyase regulatory protein HycA